MSYSVPAETIETLAANIGEVVYLDVAKWHLYLNDAKLHTLAAQRLYPLVVEGRITEAEITPILLDMRIPVGAGRQHIPLLDLMPSTCMGSLIQVLEAFQDKL